MKTKIIKILKKVKHIIIKPVSEVDKYRKLGVEIGEGTKFYSVALDMCFLHLIKIGKNCTITHSTILAHDASTQSIVGYSKVSRVVIGDNCFVGWNSTILPGVSIGDNVIVGAGSVVTRDIPSDSIVVGSPAKKIGTYIDYVEKVKKEFDGENTYISDILFAQKSQKDKALQVQLLLNGKIGFDK